MNRKKIAWIAGTVAFLLTLTTSAQEASEDVLVIKKAKTIHTDDRTTGQIVQIIGQEKMDGVEAKKSHDVFIKKFYSDISIDIDERRTEMREEFERADQNGDGYLELNELGAEHENAWYGDGNKVSEGISAITLSSSTVGISLDEAEDSTAEEQFVDVRKLHSDFEFDTAVVDGDIMDIVCCSPSIPDFEFDTADVDGDGQLTREEFRRRGQRMVARANQYRFTTLDSNQDQYIDFAEYTSSIEDLEQMDENQDGIVTSDELGFEMPSQ